MLKQLLAAWNTAYWVAFGAGFVLTLVTTLGCRALARKLGFFDCPQSNHKGHAHATPLLGGLAMFAAWALLIAGGIACLVYVPGEGEVSRHLAGIRAVSGRLAWIGISAFGALLLGLIDDKRALPAWAKFLGQFVVALAAVTLGGVRITLFLPHPSLSAALSVFWIMLLMNSINFFDNMDGLAVGTMAIAMASFTLIAALNQQFFVAALAALQCGVCCGFWCFNAAPASIFMGDAGSHFLGFLAAVTAASVTYVGNSFAPTRYSILIPLFILALPLFDTAMVVAIRTCQGKPFWIGDHNHISHRFVRMGLSRPSAVALVHLLALIVSCGILPVYWGSPLTAALLTIQALLLLLLVTFLQLRLCRQDDARMTPDTPRQDQPGNPINKEV